MHWLRLLLAALIASELFLRLPLLPAIRRARQAATKSQRLLTSKRISDHWKEKMLPYYALLIGRNSVLFFALLCVAILPVVLIGFTHPGGVGAWLVALAAPLNILALCLLSVGYIVIRSRVAKLRSGRG